MGNEIAVGEGTFLAGTVSGESDVLGTTVDADIEGTPFHRRRLGSRRVAEHERIRLPHPGA